MRWLQSTLLSSLLFIVPVMAQDNRGPKGTGTSDFIPRGLMDVLYHRQDGVSNSDKTFFGDPNATPANRGWRIHRSDTIFTDLTIGESFTTFDSVGTIFGYEFLVDGGQAMNFSNSVSKDGINGLGLLFKAPVVHNQVPAFPLHMSFDKTVSETGPTEMIYTIAGSAGILVKRSHELGNLNEQIANWRWRAPTNRGVIGQSIVTLFWNPDTDPAALRGTMHTLHAMTDSNSVNVRLIHRTEIGANGTLPALKTTTNRTWDIDQTKAGRGITSWSLLGVTQWTINSSGDFVDNAGGNLVDTIDPGSHTHVNGGVNGANLGIDSVSSTQIDDTSCLSILSGQGNPSTGATNYLPYEWHTGAQTSSTLAGTWFLPQSGKVHSLRVQISTAPGAAPKSWTFTVMKEAVATGLECVISDPSQACFDLSESPVSVVGSTRLTLRSVPNSGPVSISFARHSLCWGL